jgi:hypothetical protein
MSAPVPTLRERELALELLGEIANYKDRGTVDGLRRIIAASLARYRIELQSDQAHAPLEEADGDRPGKVPE